MDALLIVILISLVVGILLVLFSLIAILRYNNRNRAMDYIEVDNTIKAIDASVAEADHAAGELDKMAKNIFEELEGKYQELLFLYHLIDQKKQEVSVLYQKPQNAKNAPPYKQPKQQPKFSNPKLPQITKLKNEGLGIAEIAKKLDMGQGEVKLILEMAKE